MSSASPDDLVVTFRSIHRRLKEAQGESPAPQTNGPVSELNGLLLEAGQLMHATGEPTAIADAIGAVHADEWDPTVLDRLRVIALDLGRLLRHIAALTETD
ncbi:MAG: hypothetical protein Q7V88_17980 [Actinomycetota bacterium]|nr:hypothetical protein [Actinomycetota bacterium]